MSDTTADTNSEVDGAGSGGGAIRVRRALVSVSRLDGGTGDPRSRASCHIKLP